MAEANIAIEKTIPHDIFRGSVLAMIEAGIVEQKHLEPQLGRRPGCTLFMPDDSPVPEGCPAPTYLPGHLSVKVSKDGQCTVRKTVDIEERQRRQQAAPAYVSKWSDGFNERYRGTADQLCRAGVPGEWIRDCLPPGKSRGRRTIVEGSRRIQVSVGPRLEYFIQVENIEYYKQFGQERYAAERRAWGLDPVPLKQIGHLRLVSARR